MSSGSKGVLGFRFSVFGSGRTSATDRLTGALDASPFPPKNQKPKTKNRKCAFTLIEAVVATALVAIGITSAMGGLAAMAKTDRLLIQREEMQRLAVQKYGEIISTGKIQTAELSGDFSDQSIDDYEWSAEVQPSGEENLQILTVTVNPTGVADGPQASVDGLVFEPPVQGGAAQ